MSTDCDAELLQYVLQDFSNKFFPMCRSFSYNTSREPVEMVFHPFKYLTRWYLARWLVIINTKDLYSMEYRTTRTPYHTSVKALGTVQFSGGHELVPLNMFIDRTSFKVNDTGSGNRLIVIFFLAFRVQIWYGLQRA